MCGQRWRTTEYELEEHWGWAWRKKREYKHLRAAIERKDMDVTAGLLNLYHKELLAELSPTFVSLEEHQCDGSASLINESTGQLIVREGADAWRKIERVGQKRRGEPSRDRVLQMLEEIAQRHTEKEQHNPWEEWINEDGDL